MSGSFDACLVVQLGDVVPNASVIARGRGSGWVAGETVVRGWRDRIVVAEVCAKLGDVVLEAEVAGVAEGFEAAARALVGVELVQLDMNGCF